MKKSRLFEMLYDIYVIMAMRMKLILTDHITLFVLITSVLLFTFISSSLSNSAQDYSALPVGVINYDKSNEAGRLLEALQKVESLRIIEADEKELQSLLLDEMILAYFIIDEGYEERLSRGDITALIRMYYLEENQVAPILSDIVAGELIYPVSYYKSYHIYERIKFDKEKHSANEYRNYMEQLIGNSTEFNFAFQMIYENPVNKIAGEDKLSNAILYKQLIFGILGILNVFHAMYIISQTVSEKEIGVASRLKTTGFSKIKLDVGNFLAMLLTEGVITLILTGVISRKMGVQDMKLFFSIDILMLLHIMVLGGVFLLLSKFVSSMVMYQLLSSLLILITGAIGFYQLVAGFYQGTVVKIIKIIPNIWFIDGFTDIILYGKAGGYIKEGHRYLFFMSIIMILVIVIIGLHGSFRINKMSGKHKTGR